MAKLALATCQFHITEQVERNLRSITRQMKQAKAKGAQLVHFSEACLSGYLGSELKSTRQCDWESVTRGMHEVMSLAAELRLWVVVGCNHKLSGKHKPHNSLYVIDDRGRIVTRYDKMFCCGNHDNSQDLKHYSPGASFVDFTVRNVKCGLLICHDFRYPELFREYKKRGVQLILISFHLAGMKRDDYDKYMISVPATLQAAAASNFLSVSANNGTRQYACPSFIVNAEGIVVDRARPHRGAVLINTIDTNEKLYDASAAWRDRCMRGIFHSGTLPTDPRSRNRTTL
jgi:predicted amidohydrolase